MNSIHLCVSLCLPKMLPKDIKRYKRKYLGWLQGENRKLHKISGDKNLTESVHRKISHTMRNFTWCAKFFGCLLWFCRVCAILHNVRNLSFTQSCSYSSSKFLHVMQNFCIAMWKYWLLDFFPWFSSLYLYLAWQPIAKLGKGLWSAPKLRFFMSLSFNLHFHGFTKFSLILGLFQWSNSYQKHQNLPKTD